MKKIFYCFFLLFSVFCCGFVKNNKNNIYKFNFNIKKQDNKIDFLLKKYINKSTNFIYKKLGEPMEKKAFVDDSGDIIGLEFVYKYVYNFKQKKYDCHITFIIDKDTQKVVFFKKSSKFCNYILFND